MIPVFLLLNVVYLRNLLCINSILILTLPLVFLPFAKSSFFMDELVALLVLVLLLVLLLLLAVDVAVAGLALWLPPAQFMVSECELWSWLC